MLSYLLQGAVLGFSAGATPGSFLAFLLAHVSQHGFKKTWFMAFAPLLSDGPIVALMIFLVAEMPGILLRIIQIAGGFFLLYLAKGALDALKHYTFEANTSGPAGQGFLKAALVNALSPGPYIFWSSVAGPVFIKAWAQSPAYAVSYVVGFYVLLIGCSMGLVFLFATAKRLGPQVSRILTGISALALLIFGVYQIWSGLFA